MYYQLYELNHAMMAPWRAVADHMRLAYSNPLNPLSHTCFGRTMAAGLEVLERIKSDADHKQIPIVMLTSSKEEKDLVRSYQSGVNSFVVKPVEFSEFFEAIRNLGMFWAILNQPPPPHRADGPRADSREQP